MRFDLRPSCCAARRPITLEEAPEAIRVAGIEGLLVDQVTPAGETVAEVLGLPFVTVCNALALNPDPAVPPAVTPCDIAEASYGVFETPLGI